ncbi:aspartic proteinase nepenthesin-2-like [Dioscorea cayenensis subsp. rotundata]|uniref:Aspartic proteinase nepenthesin-2-like n=1 Tax=Dioscorea cayennensis subsp. rotundata TaxID=55577 RepID=A0AB40CQK2_DIOCR|nr:aspartic proteinase nepenthesin-2-like [Dioscorea cayenensis subsp. rotundata]
MSSLTIAMMLVIIFFGGAANLTNIDASDDMSFEIPIIYNGLSPSTAYNPSTNVSLVPYAGYMDALMKLKMRRRGHMYSLDTAIGTPWSRVTVSLDTGSDLTWVQCEPCSKCFDKILSSTFDPDFSTTYKTMNCEYQQCRAFYGTTTIGCAWKDERICQFKQEYMDDSFAQGDLSEDYFQFQGTNGTRKRSDSPLKFGCAHDTKGHFSPQDDGIMGMGRGKLSFITQLNISRFSHCLSMSGKSSYLSFGDAAKLEGESVGLIQNKKFPSLYYVNLLSIFILDCEDLHALDIPSKTFAIDDNGHGGFLLDTGTPFTRLHTSAYDELCRMLSEVLLLSHISTVRSIHRQSYEYCFDASLEDVEHISVVFTIDLVDVEITDRQLFYEEVDIANNPIVCLAIFKAGSSDPTTSILGGFTMSDHNIGYDLRRQIVTFNPTTC